MLAFTLIANRMYQTQTSSYNKPTNHSAALTTHDPPLTTLAAQTCTQQRSRPSMAFAQQATNLPTYQALGSSVHRNTRPVLLEEVSRADVQVRRIPNQPANQALGSSVHQDSRSLLFEEVRSSAVGVAVAHREGFNHLPSRKVATCAHAACKLHKSLHQTFVES